jgi:hypothetical protein
MIVLAYLRSQCTKFQATGWTCWSLRPFIWSSISGLMKCRDGSDKGTALNVVQISENVSRRPQKRLDKRLRKKAWAVNEKFQLIDTKKGESEEEQSQEHVYHFLWHQGEYSQEFVLVGQTVNSSYYCDFCGDCMKKCEDFSPNFGDKRNCSWKEWGKPRSILTW